MSSLEVGVEVLGIPSFERICGAKMVGIVP
jgi:hypothetical protein